MDRALKIAVVAGEVSGDLLGGDLIAALKRQHGGPVDLVGVGGEALEAEGFAVAEAGTDYCDLTGETQWMRRMIDAHADTAAASGTRSTHPCASGGTSSTPTSMAARAAGHCRAICANASVTQRVK